MRHVCGDIGDNPREYEFEPFPSTVPIPEPIPAPAEPARTHHKGYAAEHHEDVEPVCTPCHSVRERTRHG